MRPEKKIDVWVREFYGVVVAPRELSCTIKQSSFAAEAVPYADRLIKLTLKEEPEVLETS